MANGSADLVGLPGRGKKWNGATTIALVAVGCTLVGMLGGWWAKTRAEWMQAGVTVRQIEDFETWKQRVDARLYDQTMALDRLENQIGTTKVEVQGLAKGQDDVKEEIRELRRVIYRVGGR